MYHGSVRIIFYKKRKEKLEKDWVSDQSVQIEKRENFESSNIVKIRINTEYVLKSSQKNNLNFSIESG